MKIKNKLKKIYSNNNKSTSQENLKKQYIIFGKKILFSRFKEILNNYKKVNNLIYFEEVFENLNKLGIVLFVKNTTKNKYMFLKKNFLLPIGILFYDIKIKKNKLILFIKQIDLKENLNCEKIIEFINSFIDYIKKKEECLKKNIYKISKIYLKLSKNQKIKINKFLHLEKWKLESVENSKNKNNFEKKIFFNFKKKINLKFKSNYYSMNFSMNLILSDKYFSYFSSYFVDKNNQEVITDILIQNMKLCNFPNSMDIFKKKFTEETLSKMIYLKTNKNEEDIKKFINATNFFKTIIKRDINKKFINTKFINFFLKLNFDILKTKYIFDKKIRIKLSCLKFWKKYNSIKLNADFFIIKLPNPFYHLIIIDKCFKNEFNLFWKFIKNIYKNKKIIDINTKSNYLWIPNFFKQIIDLKWFGDKQSLYKFNLDFNNFSLKKNFFDTAINDFVITKEFVFGIIEVDLEKESILPIFFSIIKNKNFITKEIKTLKINNKFSH